MGRSFAGFIAATRPTPTKLTFEVSSTFTNPGGDWGPRYVFAHPRDFAAFLKSSDQAKMLFSTDRAYHYFVTVTNLGPNGTLFDIDF